ncbi:MAG: hypothetical protein AAF462_04615 [Thermodesulfobacteriota bacterium]
MFQKLRSDLVKELSPIRLVLVNADGFSENGKAPSTSLGLNGSTISVLRDEGVECVAFSALKSQEISSVAEKMGIELHQSVLEKSDFYAKMKSEFSLQDTQIALICRDQEDLVIMKKASFSAATSEAPLEVKAHSYYAAYNKGSGAVEEIAELIIKSKKYPDGWSE